jgi:hypothetical protein
VRHGSEPALTWQRPQMVLLSVQGTGAAAIDKVAFTSKDRVRDRRHAALLTRYCRQLRAL